MRFQAIKNLLKSKSNSNLKIVVDTKASYGEYTIASLAIRFFIALCGSIGSVLCFSSATGVIDYTASSLLLSVFICGGIAVLCYFLQKDENRLDLVILCGFTLIMFIAASMFERVQVGVYECVNRFTEIIFEGYDELALFEIDTLYDVDSCVTLTVLLITALITFATATAVIRHTSLLLTIIALMPLPEICLYFGMSPSLAAFGMVICCIGALAVCDMAEMDVVASTKTSSSQCAILSCITIAVIYIFAYCGASAIGYERPDSLDEIRDNMKLYIENFSWEKLSDDIKTANPFYNQTQLTHDGKLGNNESVEFTGEHMLSVTLPVGENTIYLKGFTGVDYTGTRWESYTDTTETTTLLTSLDFFTGRMYPYFCGDVNLNSAYMFIQNIGIDSDVRYIPSNSAGMIESTEQGRRYATYFPIETSWRTTIIENAESGVTATDEVLKEDELLIRQTAYSQCLDVPSTFTADGFFDDYDGDSIEDELKYIRNKLSQLCEYTLDSGKRPFGSDFANWFLNENQKGSCTHFASTAVLLCRMRGIPARYCEGFIVKPEDMLAEGEVGDVVTLAIADTRAHAWIEVYIDGYGWLTYEVTPGYGAYELDVESLEDESWENANATLQQVEPEIVTEAPLESVTETSTYSATETLANNSTTEADINEDASTETVTASAMTSYEGVQEGEAEEQEQEEQGENEQGENEQNADYGENGEGEQETTTNTNEEEANTDKYTDQEAYFNDVYNEEETTTTITTTTYYDEDIPEEYEEEEQDDNSDNNGKALLDVIVFIAVVIIIVGAFIIRRQAVFMFREKLLLESPNKSAQSVYKSLTSAAKQLKVDISQTKVEDMATHLSSSSDYFDENVVTLIVDNALVSKFGKGIDSDSANISVKSINVILDKIYMDKKWYSRFISKWIIITDKYL